MLVLEQLIGWMPATHSWADTHPPIPRHIKMTVSRCSCQTNTSADPHAPNTGKIRSQLNIRKCAGSPPRARSNTAGLTSEDAPARQGWGWGRACSLRPNGGWSTGGPTGLRRGGPLPAEPSTLSSRRYPGPRAPAEPDARPGVRFFPRRRSPSGRDPSTAGP